MDSSECMVRSQIQSQAQRSPKRKFDDLEQTSTVSIARADQEKMDIYTSRNAQENTSAYNNTRWIYQTVYATLSAIAMHAFSVLWGSAKRSYHKIIPNHAVIEIRSSIDGDHESVKRRSIEHDTKPADRRFHPSASIPPHMMSATTSGPTHMEQIDHAFKTNSGRHLQLNIDPDTFNLYRHPYHQIAQPHTFYSDSHSREGYNRERGRDAVELDIDHLSIPGKIIDSDNDSDNGSDIEFEGECIELIADDTATNSTIPYDLVNSSKMVEVDMDTIVDEEHTAQYGLSTTIEEPQSSQDQSYAILEEVSTGQDEPAYSARHNRMPGDIFAFDDGYIDSEETQEPQDHRVVVDSNTESQNIDWDLVHDIPEHDEPRKANPELDESIWTPHEFAQNTYTDIDFASLRTHVVIPAPVTTRNNSQHDYRMKSVMESSRPATVVSAHMKQHSRIKQPRVTTPAQNSRRQSSHHVQKDDFSPALVEDRSFDGPSYPTRRLKHRLLKHVNPLKQTEYFTMIPTPLAQRAVYRNGRSPAHNPVKRARFSASPGSNIITVTTKIFDPTNKIPQMKKHLENRQLARKSEQTIYDMCLTTIPQILQNSEQSSEDIKETGMTGPDGSDIGRRSNTEPPAPGVGAPTQDADITVSEMHDNSIEMTDASRIPTIESPSSLNQSVERSNLATAQTITPAQSPPIEAISDVAHASKVPLPQSPERPAISQAMSGSRHGLQKSHAPAKSSSNESLNDAINSMSISRDKSKKRKEEKAAAEAEAKRLKEEAEAAEAKRLAEEKAKAAGSRRMPSVPIIRPISVEWESRLRREMQKPSSAVIAKSVTGQDLVGKDFATLLGQTNWLNDEIINAYLEAIVDYSNAKAGSTSRGITPKFLTQNSFFYRNIADKGPASVARWMKRKKADGAKLLNVEQMFIPVNNASHWTMIIVSPSRRTIEYLDSFGGPQRVFVANIKRWLAQELGAAWNPEEWKVLETKSAIQTNGYDCGVFAITNAKCVALGLDPTCYSGRDLAMQRRCVAAELIAGGFVGEFTPPGDL